MSGPAQLLTEREAADLLRVSTEALRKWRAAGRIGYVKVGRKPLYRAEHVEVFLRKNEHAPLRIAGRK